MPEILLSLDKISKFQGDKPVLRNISLRIEQGEAVLILGANGAGKSTLLRLMAGLGRPSSGKVEQKENLRLAYIGHPTFLYPGLTAMQNLAFQAKIHGLKLSADALMAILEKAGLASQAHEPARVFSRGMAQRLNFFRALMLEPELFLLDEPFTGMDSHSQSTLREELQSRRDNGASLVLVSHAPELDAPLANKILTLAKGKLSCSC